MRKGGRAGMALVRLAALAVALGLLIGQALPAAGDSHRSPIKKFKHVFVVMMENTGYDALIGNPNAPFINRAVSRFGVARNYFGVIHPSQPNYIATTAGQIGNDSDDDETLDVPNIVDQLERRRPDLDGLPAIAVAVQRGRARAFVRQPALRAQAQPVRLVRGRPVEPGSACRTWSIWTSLMRTSQRGKVSDFNFIAPDQCHDMHGRAALRGRSLRLLQRAATHRDGRFVPAGPGREDHPLARLPWQLRDLHRLGRERLHRLARRLRVRRHAGLLRRQSGWRARPDARHLEQGRRPRRASSGAGSRTARTTTIRC